MAAAQISSQAGYNSAMTLPDLQYINPRGIYEGQYRDRYPDLRAAGKLTATGESTVQCMRPGPRPTSPEVIRRFRNYVRPDAGKTTIFYGKAYDPHLQWAATMSHGIRNQPSLKAGQLLNPMPNSRFHQRHLDKKEGVYSSHQRAPLGVSHDQSIGLPKGLDASEFTFGVRTERDGCAGELINPDKTRQQVFRESQSGHELYRSTHSDYNVGERCSRNYVQPNFSSYETFGLPTPHDNGGKLVRKNLTWIHDTESEKYSPVVSNRVDEFRERTQPQLGKVHDPIKDTMHVPSDHTFGILIKPDEYGVGDLMHSRNPDSYLRGKDRLRGVIAAMRQHLKKCNYHAFDDLLAAFKFYDKDGCGKINIRDLQEACRRFNLPTDPELLTQLMDYCDTDRDGLINYTEFANFLNWKDKLPSGIPEQRLTQSAPTGTRSGPTRLQKQIDAAPGNYGTSSSMINGAVGGISNIDYRSYGVPTVRSDLAAPRMKRISDRTNYGEVSDAYGLISPSIFSTYGLSEKDFLRSRSREELRTIFTNIGVEMDYETFDKLYDTAASRHPARHVSVEGFRSVLDLAQAEQVQKQSPLTSMHY